MYLSIITLNVGILNALIKRHRVVEWIIKECTACCLQETCFRAKTHIDWKWEDEKSISCKWRWRKDGLVILISDKIDFIYLFSRLEHLLYWEKFILKTTITHSYNL